MDCVDFGKLLDRVGEAHFRQRLHIQVEHVCEVFGTGRTSFHIENAKTLLSAINHGLHWFGLYQRGLRGYKNLRVVHNRIRLLSLPDAFAGFKILHLTDLHLDLQPGFVQLVTDKCRNLEYDICVLTGDYRAGTSGNYAPAVRDMTELALHLRGTPYAVLGNHDFIEMVPQLERAGYRFLLNESVSITRNQDCIYISGVDDPHFYQTDNLQKARDVIPSNAFAVLLSHSPEIYLPAAACGFDLMLCGHTHGGQICLPGRTSVISNGRCPRSMVYGNWLYGQMKGYTSSGAGACGVPARFFCPPEVVIHELLPITPEGFEH
jgi:hypothetical protein